MACEVWNTVCHCTYGLRERTLTVETHTHTHIALGVYGIDQHARVLAVVFGTLLFAAAAAAAADAASTNVTDSSEPENQIWSCRLSSARQHGTQSKEAKIKARQKYI